MVCIGIGLLLLGIVVAFHGLRKDRDAKVATLTTQIDDLKREAAKAPSLPIPAPAILDEGTGTRIIGASGVGHPTFIHSAGEGGVYSEVSSVAPDPNPQPVAVVVMSDPDLVRDTMQLAEELREYCVSRSSDRPVAPHWDPSSRSREEFDVEWVNHLNILEGLARAESVELSALFEGRTRAIAVQYQLRGMMTPYDVESMVFQSSARVRILNIAGRLEALARGLSPESFRPQ